MISSEEVHTIAARFGTPDSQVVRDHLISHVVAALGSLPDNLAAAVTFIGGTALCRTWCPDLRLSEDIDLLIGSPTPIDTIQRHISRNLRREFPDHAWTHHGTRHDVDTRLLNDRTSMVRVQYLWGRPAWQQLPAEQAPVALRYSDLPQSVQLTVPSPTSFAAMKLMAWLDRATPRDLFDLAALANAGHIDHETMRLVRQVAGYTPTPSTLGQRIPKQVIDTWQAELGHQLSETLTPAQCLTTVSQALNNLKPENND